MRDLIILSIPDSNLNGYFEKCRNHLVEFISSQSIEINIHGEHGIFTKDTLAEKIQCFTDRYALIIYAHGTDKSVIDTNGIEILHESQASILHNALVYSTACSNASSLGFQLSQYGCNLFFGYSDKAYIPISQDNFIENTFIETDNFAILQILSRNIDCQQLSIDTENFFKQKYNEIKYNYPDDAAWLMHNKESVRFYQNRTEC